MTKTPEQMAKEWAHVPRVDQDMDECDLTWDNVFDWEVKSFLAGYQAAQQWISVKERLPEDVVGWTMVYGCILSRWSVQPGFYDRQLKKWVSRFINGYEDDEGYATLESVTHWMPLLEPPKGEQ